MKNAAEIGFEHLRNLQLSTKQDYDIHMDIKRIIRKIHLYINSKIKDIK